MQKMLSYSCCRVTSSAARQDNFKMYIAGGLRTAEDSFHLDENQSRAKEYQVVAVYEWAHNHSQMPVYTR